MKLFSALAVFAAGIALAACSEIPEDAAELGVDFTFQERHRCSETSPAIRVSGAPESTVGYRVKLVDLDVPSFNHGGGEVSQSSGRIRPGALESYIGPCPPIGTHTYEFRVSALDADGRIVGYGTATQEF